MDSDIGRVGCCQHLLYYWREIITKHTHHSNTWLCYLFPGMIARLFYDQYILVQLMQKKCGKITIWKRPWYQTCFGIDKFNINLRWGHEYFRWMAVNTSLSFLCILLFLKILYSWKEISKLQTPSLVYASLKPVKSRILETWKTRIK